MMLQVGVAEDSENVSGSSHIEIPDCGLKADLGSMLERKLFSDLVLMVGNREFPAHRATLAGNTVHVFSTACVICGPPLLNKFLLPP